MKLNLKQVTLYSARPEALASFLGGILDYDDYQLDPRNEKQIIIESSGWTFCLRKAKVEHLFSLKEKRDLEINFSVNNRAELDDLLHKVQFLHYRQDSGDKEVAVPKLLQNGNEVYFEAIDPDGRQWVFSCQSTP